MARQAGKRPQGGRKGRPRQHEGPCRRWSTSGTPACRRSITATTSARWRRTRGWRTPLPFPASCRPISARCSAGHRPVPLVRALGRPGGHLQDRRQDEGAVPRQRASAHWLDMARERIAFQGLPARICWIGLGDRHRAGLAFNEMVASGELKAPVVIGRDHLDSGSVASAQPRNRGDEGRLGRGQRLAAAERAGQHRVGATWVSLHHGGGVGMGFSQHSGMVIVRRRHAGCRASGSSGCCGTIRPPA
jgi:hypothetical protein